MNRVAPIAFCRIEHRGGLLLAALITRLWRLLAIGVIQGYGFAWIGHFFFEPNRPATFEYSAFSLMGDWRMWWEILSAKRSL